jgi:hypothetical protein
MLAAESPINAESRAEAPIDTESRAEALPSITEVDLRLDLRLFFRIDVFLCFMDGHPQATVVLFPCYFARKDLRRPLWESLAAQVRLFHHL